MTEQTSDRDTYFLAKIVFNCTEEYPINTSDVIDEDNNKALYGMIESCSKVYIPYSENGNNIILFVVDEKMDNGFTAGMLILDCDDTQIIWTVAYDTGDGTFNLRGLNQEKGTWEDFHDIILNLRLKYDVDAMTVESSGRSIKKAMEDLTDMFDI